MHCILHLSAQVDRQIFVYISVRAAGIRLASICPHLPHPGVISIDPARPLKRSIGPVRASSFESRKADRCGRRLLVDRRKRRRWPIEGPGRCHPNAPTPSTLANRCPIVDPTESNSRHRWGASRSDAPVASSDSPPDRSAGDLPPGSGERPPKVSSNPRAHSPLCALLVHPPCLAPR